MPHSNVLAFNDPHAFQASIRASDVEVVVAERGPFRSHLQKVDLHALWMQRSTATAPLVARSAVHRSRCVLFFATSANQAPIAHAGQTLLADAAAIIAPGAEHFVRLPPNTGWAAMSLSPHDLAGAARAMLGRDLPLPRTTRHVTLDRTRMARLRGLHARAASLAATNPAALAHPEVLRAVEHALIEAMLACVADGAAVDAAPPDSRASPAIMRRFHEVVEAEPRQPFHVADLCRALGVSARSLARYSIEHLGMPAHRYLWLRRMQMAHRALRAANPATTSVTRIAHDHGFGELGRFAVAYRDLFGEPPSATLRRPAGA